MDVLKKRLDQAERGKAIFKEMFDLDSLSTDDAFLLVLTNHEECISYGIKYLPQFKRKYHKRKVFVLLDSAKFEEKFSAAGGTVKKCNEENLQDLAVYFSVFHKKVMALDTRMIFLTERDEYGYVVEELIDKGEFSLEEYVSVALLQLSS